VIRAGSVAGGLEDSGDHPFFHRIILFRQWSRKEVIHKMPGIFISLFTPAPLREGSSPFHKVRGGKGFALYSQIFSPSIDVFDMNKMSVRFEG
jgi:hypothetical protein